MEIALTLWALKTNGHETHRVPQRELWGLLRQQKKGPLKGDIHVKDRISSQPCIINFHL